MSAEVGLFLSGSLLASAGFLLLLYVSTKNAFARGLEEGILTETRGYWSGYLDGYDAALADPEE